MDQSHLRWFCNEQLPLLREQGVLPADSLDALERWYRPRLDVSSHRKSRFLTILLAIFCALFVGLGLALLVAHNWDDFPVSVRMALGYAPFLPGAFLGYIALYRDKGPAWREPAAILTAIGIATSIAVTCQIYNLGGSLSDFLLFCGVLMIPLPFLFRSIGAAAMGFLFAVWGNSVFGYRNVPEWNAFLSQCLPLIFAACPLARIFRPSETGDWFLRTIRGVMPFAVLLYLLTSVGSLATGLFWFCFFALFGALGANSLPIRGRMNAKDFPPAVLFLSVGLLLLASPGYAHSLQCRNMEAISFPLGSWPLLTASLIAAGYLVFRAGRAGHWGFLLPLLLGAGPVICLIKPANAVFLPYLSSALGVAAAVQTVVSGVKYRGFATLNLGLFLMLGLIAVWFFASEVSIVGRGIAFIAAGLLVGGLNLIFRRVVKRGVSHD